MKNKLIFWIAVSGIIFMIAAGIWSIKIIANRK
ncbi:MAG: hypothetical protein ACFWUE_12185 [Xylanivirga thermophila]